MQWPKSYTTDFSFPKFSLAELKKFKVADLRQLAVGFSINPALRKPELQ